MFEKTALTETVTVTRPVSDTIADLVNFYKYVHYRMKNANVSLTDAQLINLARDFWDMEHGE
jgi:hypothetical protein